MRGYPGQLPSVRKDIFNLIIPIDFSNLADIEIAAEQLTGFVKRKLPLRFGLVPLTKNAAAAEQAKIIYHLMDSYGVSAVVAYLQSVYAAKGAVSSRKSNFETAIAKRKLRHDEEAKSFDDALSEEAAVDRIIRSQKWISRLGADSQVPPLFVDGVAVPRNENWLQAMSQQINADVQAIQRGVYEKVIVQDHWIPMFFLLGSNTRRNPLIIPEEEKSLNILDVGKLHSKNVGLFGQLPAIEADESSAKADGAYVLVIADPTNEKGQRLLSSAVEFRKANPAINLAILPNADTPLGLLNAYAYMADNSFAKLRGVDSLETFVQSAVREGSDGNKPSYNSGAEKQWTDVQKLLKDMDIKAGQQAILVNGRLVGPIPASLDFTTDDFTQLLEFERSKRITPVLKAMEALGLSEKFSSPLQAAKMSSLVALSFISDIPDGIVEQAPLVRMSAFNLWKSEHTVIEVGNAELATINIVITLDPTSESSQRWIPMLKVLSELDGVHLKLYLNPRDRLQELPIKRFYRYVLESKPSFDGKGALRSIGAKFAGVPQEALLNLGMDVPPAWLVAPKESIHDLDNIKLSTTKGNVDAIYELEHILIEGHSREKSGQAPRGAQLVLKTERDPHFADTIIMANLGYFQFKANPGFYKIDLLDGRSSEIFEIETLGLTGRGSTQKDESNEVLLMSFQGVTLYPQIARKLGQEEEDVLEPKSSVANDLMAQGKKFAENYLGFGKSKHGHVAKVEQAEINIFSVASGHLYERMLNIMMVSVMKHTKHTVKFWFIEQFLSPSFKEFIPFLAAEYGFQYEMVTYKWPHWLRQQKEKQREIWGYKILFLDVLFPISLEKVIFVDADQIVRTDMIELVKHDLKGAPYGFTPMGDSRTEMEGFRFWKQGYWKNYLKGLPYHISALYVVDLRRFRQIAAGDRLRQQYQSLSADPGSLSNLDQDLPNHMQTVLPIHSLPQEWLWCETWCSDEDLKTAKTIDLCNNPMTKEPKLDRARRQVPEWTVYDDEIAALNKKRKAGGVVGAQETVKNPKSRTLEAKPSGKDEL
jgi:UDP-glucose:glycoprotein glucosyltransferase